MRLPPLVRAVWGVGIVLLCALGCGAGNPASPPPQARFVRQVEWIDRGEWLKAETHTHTKFSDGAHTVDRLVDKAAEFGCQVLAVTDHGDKDLKAATPQYFDAIDAARQRHPKMVLFAGLEWNLPPWGGEDHATVLVLPEVERQVIAELKQRFDDYHRKPHDAALAEEALRWLAERGTRNGVPPVVLWNHPGRAWKETVEIVPHVERFRKVNDLWIGFEGAPGHQQSERIGAYKYEQKPIDRWDPAAARVGDAWDQLLQKGHDVWGALASSDVHQAEPRPCDDYWPGEFAETWLYVPERSAAGALKALRAGTFFGVHGHVVREVELRVDAPGLPRPAQAGESIAVPPGTRVKVTLQMTVPATDWQGQPNRIDKVELIAVTAEAARVIAERRPQASAAALVEEIEVPEGGVVLRARGRRVVEDGPHLMFYTNPVRVLVENPGRR